VLLQMIEGIPYFYRRFGYDYALAYGGAPTIPAGDLPAPVADAAVRARPAVVEDADALAAIDRALVSQDRIVCPRDGAGWRYELVGRDPDDLVRRAVTTLVDPAGTIVGYAVHSVQPSTTGYLAIFATALRRSEDWPVATPVLLAYLGDFARRSDRPFTCVWPLLDADHPLSRFGPLGTPHRPFAWYLRTGDPVALLDRWRPALVERWEAAGLRWSGESMTINLYGRSIRLEFSDGRLATVSPGPALANDPAAQALVPPAALLQLVLGYRSLPEVLDAWPDAVVRDRVTEVFLDAAFPRVAPMIWPVN
jgi:hypothetical protein